MCKWFKVLLVVFFVGANVKFLYFIQDNFKAPKALNLALETQVAGLDPVRSTYYSSELLSKVYECLLEYHYLKRPYELVPNLAAEMPTVSEDGRTYTFVLRRGVLFHNSPCFPNGQGRELVAEDVVYSFKRIAEPKAQSAYFPKWANLIQGFAAFHQHLLDHPGAYETEVSGIQALDRYTVRFVLTKPFPQFLHLMAAPFSSVVPKEAVAHYGDRFMHHPVGTGPFLLQEFSPQQTQIVFQRNPRFRAKYFPKEASPACQHLMASAGQQLPLIEKLVYHILPEAPSRWEHFQAGKLDVLEVPSAYLSQVYEGSKFSAALQKANIRLLEAPSIDFAFFGFNCDKYPLDNQKLRQAMSLAFDRKTCNRLFEDSRGILSHSFIPSWLEGYDKNFHNPYIGYDLPRAQRLLAEAGYPGGKGLPILKVHTTESDSRKPQAEFFARCMAQIGIKIEIETLPFPELVSTIERGDFLISLLAYSADTPDAQCMLELFRYPGSFSGIVLNDATFNALHDRAVALPDSPEKTALYEELNARLTELVPSILIPLSNQHFLVHKRVKNYCISPFHFCKEMYLDVG